MRCYSNRTERTEEEQRAWNTAKSRAWRERNPDRQKLVALLSYHKISKSEYDRLKEQFTHCPICRRKFDGNVKPHIDHCHKTKLIRGLLCGNCNWAEGHLKTVESARRLYEYMLKNEIFYQGGN